MSNFCSPHLKSFLQVHQVFYEITIVLWGLAHLFVDILLSLCINNNKIRIKLSLASDLFIQAEYPIDWTSMIGEKPVNKSVVASFEPSNGFLVK